MNKDLRIGRKLLCLIIALVMVMTLIPRLPASVAYADAGQVPAHSKTREANGDGTYKLSLDVTGDADTEKPTAKANILIVYDVSGSMDYDTYKYTETTGTTGEQYGYFNGGYNRIYYRNGAWRQSNSNYGTVYNGIRYTRTTLSRGDAAEKVVYDFSNALFAYNKTADADNVEMALVAFSSERRNGSYNSGGYTGDPGNGTTAAWEVEGWTTDKNAYLDNFSSTGNNNSAKMLYGGGTNWEAAMQRTLSVLGEADADPTYVVFVTDGLPTFYVTGGNGYSTTTAEYRAPEGEVVQIENYNTATHSVNANDNNTTLYGIFAFGGTEDRLDDLIYYAQNGTRRETQGTTATPNYYNATDQAALSQAISDIFATIAETLGIGSVAITDGTTTNVETQQGVSHLLAVEPDTYDYWLTLPVSGSGPYTATRKDLVTSEDYTITFTAAEDGTYTATWTDSTGAHEVTGIEGSVSMGKFKYRWTEANDLYKYGPPEAHYDDSASAVKWDLSSVGTLLDGVTYTVTFNVYPTQETYDMIADLENGKLEYDDLDPAIQQYLKQEANGSYTLETNTTTDLAYADTRVDDTVHHVEFENPPRVATAVEKMDITKYWFNDLDYRGEEQYETGFTMDVTRDGTVVDSVTVKPDDWSDQIYISTGLMRVHRNDNNEITGIEVLDTGHDYTLKEPANMAYYWELVIETLHPMLVNGELHSLVEVKEADIPEGMGDADFYTLEGVDFYRIGGKVFEDNGSNDNDTASVSAYNERKSNLNITKTITGNADMAPEDALFSYTVSVKDNNGDDVWFSVQDAEGNYVSDEASITGATAEVKDDGTRTGSYYAPSEGTITFKLKAGWNVRFFNLPTYSTYSVEESSTMDPGFSFDNVNGTTEFKVGGLPDGAVDLGNNQYSYDGVIYTKVSDTEYTAVYEPTITGMKVDGKIVSANAPYQVTFANKYTPTKVTPKVTKAVSGKDAEEAFAFSIEAGDAATTRAITAGDVTMPDPATATTEAGIKDGATGTATFGDIVFNSVGTYTFTVKETNSNPPAGWTYANTDADAKTITVEVTSGENGLVADVTGNNPTFTNSYDEVTAAPSVTKEVKGWDAIDQFTFSIALKSGEAANVKMPDATTVTTKTEGKIKKDGTEKLTFNDITFYAEGTYVFTIDETTTTTAKGWTYDASTKDVTVVVSKDNNGKLVANIQNDNPTFTNSYEAAPIKAKIPVTKNIVPKGSSTTDITGKFTFTLAAVTEGAPMPTPATVTSAADGVAAYFNDIEFTKPGTYEYTITESITDGSADVNGITLETGEPRSISVTVKDNGTGILIVETNNGATFNNPYQAKSLDIVIPVKKTLEVPEGLTGPDITEGYTFTIADDPSDEVSSPLPETKTVKNPGARGGDMSFGGEATGKITVTQPGTYKYIITESGSFQGVTNDAAAASGKVVTVVVTDNKNGTMSYTINGEGTADDTTEFVNVYSAESVKASFPVKKVMTIPKDAEEAPTEWSYTINVTAGEGAPSAESMTGTVSNTNDTVTFGDFTFTAPGKYTYTVTESGEIAGVVNDANATTGKTVTVVVEDGKEGKLVIKSISSTTESPLQFTNTYHETGITIPVTKQLKKDPENLEGPDITGKYTFTIAGSTGAPLPEKTSVVNNGGAMEFGPITFKDAGTYTYTVTETGTVDGVTNDSDKTVTVTVTRGEDGELTATLGDVKSFDFINTYTVEPTTASFPVKKMISKPDDAEGPADWSYDVKVAAQDGAPEAEVMEGKVTKAAPSTTFGPFEYTAPGKYTYTVTESGTVPGVVNETGNKTVTVTVVDNKDGTLTATADSTTEKPATFTNSYSYEGTEAVLQVKKTLSVPEGLEGPDDISEEFEFTLSAVTEGAPMPAGTGNVVKNPDADGGLAKFGNISYTKPGEYTYKIVESAGNVDGVTNDTSEQTVTVKIVDGSDGKLKVDSIKYSNGKANAEFTNVYSVEKTTASFPVEKIMTIPQGLTGPADWSYDVKVAAQDGAPAAKVMEGKVTKAAPSTTFGPFEYTAPGTYKYTVSETGTVKGVTNDKDAAGKTVTVVVKDGKDGKLVVDSISATEKEPLTFTNTYSVENTTASFPVKKDMVVPEGLTGPAKWSYDVKVEAQEGAPEAKTMKGTVSNETDTVTFGDFTYSMPGTYKYTVSETGTIKGVTNDAQAAGKTVTVTVVDNGDGTLTATPDFNAEKPLTFTNTYSVEKTTAGFPVEKIMTVPEGLTGPADWSYAVKVAAQDGAPEAETMEGTVTKAEPSVTFDGFTYTMPGTYKYTVSEAGQVAGVANDAQAAGKTVTVTVVDNGDGTLTATPDFTEKAPLQFTNTYSVKETTASFPVKKNMVVPEELDGPESWSYEIKVEAKDGAPAAETMTGTVTDKADTVTFGEFTYTMPGTYKYTVSEAGDIAGVTNDKEAKGKEVTVTVVDNGDGTLTATADSTADAPLAFTNTYSVEKVIVDPPVKKILKDADLKDHEGEFTFKIEGKTAPEGVEEIPMPTNTEITNSKKFLKDGSTDLYEFGEIEYLVPGTYTYTVSEVGGKLDYIKYDGSEYTLTVTVTDNKDGTLSAKMDPEEGEMVFNNEYTAAGTFNIEAKKVLKGADLKDGQFTFTLEGPEGKLPETVSVKNKADGTVTFGPIAIDQNDVGKTFEYTITEVNDKQANVAYDAKKITAKVTVVDNHDGTLSVKTDYSDKATFTNKYEEPPVKTGDTTVIVPYIVIGLASIALLLMILFRRRKAN